MSEDDSAPESAFREYLAGRADMDLAMREEALVAAVRQLKGALDTLRKGALQLAPVLHAQHPNPRSDSATLQAGYLVLHAGDGLAKVEYPAWMKPPPERGDIVRLSKEQVLAVDPSPAFYGVIFTVTRALSQPHSNPAQGRGYEVDGKRVVFASKKYVKEELAVGTQVVLDSTMSVIVKSLGKLESTMAFEEESGVSWDDIGGQDEAKQQIKDALEGPVRHAALYKEFGLVPTRGILLFGPPGNGKTMFGKAAATAVRAMFGGKAKGGFLYVKGPEVLNMYVGESEGAVRKLFDHARLHYEEAGYPCVIYVDEADALVGKRGERVNLGMEATIVPQFLAEMDGLDASRALVVLSTNRPDVLDPAVVRDGRVDLKVHVRRPGKVEAADILTKTLAKRLLAEPAAELAAGAVEELFAARHGVAMIRVRRGADRRVTLADFLSGAMCVGIVNRATKKALDRHIASDGPKGLTAADVGAAARETGVTIKHLDMQTELSDIVDEIGADNVKKVEPIT